MLTKFFSTTKPTTIIVVLIYMSLGFFYSNIALVENTFTWQVILKIIGMWLLYIFAMFVLNFIVQKNELTKKSTYGILLFAALSLVLPPALQNLKILLSGLLVLISLRRILSLRSGLQMERKIFDATLWILFASLTVFYSWVFIIVLFLAFAFYGNSSVRYFFIPFIALFGFSVIGYSVLLYMYDTYQNIDISLPVISFNFKSYNKFSILISISFIIGTLLWALWSYLKEQNKASASQKGRYGVVLTILLVSFLFIIITNDKTGAEWYFVIPSVAIIVSNYLDNTESLFFKESLLWFIVLLPLIIYLV